MLTLGNQGPTFSFRFILANRFTAEQAASLHSGGRPKFEYDLLAGHYGAELTSSDELLQHSGLLSSQWLRTRHLSLALSGNVSKMARNCMAVVAPSEEIGIPLILNSLIHGWHTRVACLFHGHYLKSAKFQALIPLLRHMEHLHMLCLTETLCSRLVRQHGFSPSRCFNVSYGVDTDFFTPEVRTGPPLIASAGSSGRDFVTLIRAIEGLDIHLEIAARSIWQHSGEMPELPSVPPNVQFSDPPRHLGLRDLYARSRFVVVPLLPAQHGSGLSVIAEAMAMGKAVIVTRTEGQGDLVVEGETGFYVDAGDAEQLRHKIQLLLDNPDMARRMGESARARTELHFSLERFCSRIIEVVTS
jgi:glycosyltransferase involved in cell wall biosynthesis